MAEPVPPEKKCKHCDKKCYYDNDLGKRMFCKDHLDIIEALGKMKPNFVQQTPIMLKFQPFTWNTPNFAEIYSQSLKKMYMNFGMPDFNTLFNKPLAPKR